MFIAYSRETKTNQYLVTSKNDACKKCGNHEDMLLRQEIATWKLFWLIPIFRWTSYTLHCPVCGKYTAISASVGKTLINLSVYQHIHGASTSKNTPAVFDEFSNNLNHAPTVSQETPISTNAKTEVAEEASPMETPTEKLGEKIYQLRRSLYMSQEQFGDKIGVSRQTICKWELDKAQPDEKNIENMLNRLSLPLDYFKTKKEKINFETKNNDNVTINSNSPTINLSKSNTQTYPSKKGSPLLSGLSIAFGLALLIFNIVITIIYQVGSIQFPIFWFYIGSFIAANAMLIPVALCAISKRKIAASLLSFLSYVLIAVFTLGGAIPTYEKPETRYIYHHQNILITLSSPFSYKDFWSSGENTLLFKMTDSYFLLLTFQWEEGKYNTQRDTSIILYGVDYDGKEHILEQGYLFDAETLAYNFSLNFNQYPSFKLRFSNEGITRFRISWALDEDKYSSPG